MRNIRFKQIFYTFPNRLKSLLTSKAAYHLPVLVMLFTLLNALLFWKLGIRIVDDSPRYLQYANNIIEKGFYFDPHEFWYFTYTAFIIAIRSLHDSIAAVIIAQYILSLLGMISLYHAASRLYASKGSGFVAAVLYIGFFEISIYNSYILCESLYISLTAISLNILVYYYKKTYPLWTLVLGPLILLATVFAKPTGMGLLAGVLAVSLYGLLRNIPKLHWRIATSICIALPFLLLVNKMLTPFGFMNDYQRGELIFGMFHYPDSPHYTLLTIERPDPLYFPDTSLPPLIRLILFILNHPIYWIQLFLGKVFLLFSHIRPFWATWHNLYSLLFLIPVYAAVVFNLFGEKDIKLKIFVLIFIGFHALSVGMLTDDWDGRFLLPVLPLIFLLVNVKKLTDLKT
jgi:hypothetical protein